MASTPSSTHLEGSSTSVGRPGYCHSPVLVVKIVDVIQPTLLHAASYGVHVSQFWSSSGSHTFYLHVHHCSGDMAFISTSDMSIPAQSLLHRCVASSTQLTLNKRKYSINQMVQNNTTDPKHLIKSPMTDYPAILIFLFVPSCFAGPGFSFNFLVTPSFVCFYAAHFTTNVKIPQISKLWILRWTSKLCKFCHNFLRQI